MHKSAIINDTFDNLSFSINDQVHKKYENNLSKNAEPITKNNVTLDDSIFNDFTNQKLPETNKCTKPNAKKITQQIQSRKANTQIKLITQSDPTIRELSSWGLPSSVLAEYASRKITTMFPWQCDCLLSHPDILSRQKNLIYSAPTSAGKTLVAEIIAIKTVLERGKKVIFILPFISVVREKMIYFQDIFGTSGVRVEGYMGSYSPPGGFQNINIAICTMEKANGLINRLLEEGNLSLIGAVIVDELHMLGDPSRGYLLELLLTKLLYMTNKSREINIQIIGMSATLPNLDTLADWLNASLYTTQFRPIPLIELCQISGSLYDHQMNLLRKLEPLDGIDTDVDNILQLCLEPIKESCSVLIFCPSKQWCETLALQIAEAFYKLGGAATTAMGKMLRTELNEKLIIEVLEQLKTCPVGMDAVLKKTVSFAVAFHHAGLTMDERDIIESAFRSGALRVIVATSTLSSGVNLPAKRVIVRTPRTMGNMLDVFVYRQMIGRAGRMGKDTSGDSVLLCKAGDERIARKLMGAELTPVESCLEGAGKLKRAILEVISSGVAISDRDVVLFTNYTLLAKTTIINSNLERENKDVTSDPISEAIDFLIDNEFIKKHVDENNETMFVPTSLARACLCASMAPDEGLALFSELERVRRCIVLETDLHLVYMVTPYSACSSWPQIDWMQYLDIWERLGPSMRRVGDLVGVRSAFLLRAVQIGLSNKNYNKELLIHTRFFISLALQDLINEVPLSAVSTKYSCNRGLLQSLQQSAATFAGMVTSFSRQLGWASVELLIGQFQDRLHFGVTRELLDLMRLPLLNGQRARILHSAGIETLVNLANSSTSALESILLNGTPFISGRYNEGISVRENNERKDIKCVWINSRNEGLTEHEAAVLLVNEARRFLQLELGLDGAKWSANTQENCPEKVEDSNDENLIEKMRNSSINDESVVLIETTNNSIPKKSLRIVKDIKHNSVLDQLIPTLKSMNENTIAHRNDNISLMSIEKNYIYTVDKVIANHVNKIATAVETTCFLKNVETNNIITITNNEPISAQKASITKTDLDLSDQLSGFSYRYQDSHRNDDFNGSIKPSEVQPDQFNSQDLFDNSKESDSIFGLNNYTEIIANIKSIEVESENILNESISSDTSLNLHLSLDSTKSNLDGAINISKEILFEDTFDSNVIDINITTNKDCVKSETITNSDSGLFENDSALEEAFANSFIKDDNNTLREECCQENSQNVSDTIVEDSPKNTKVIYETSRILKRSRLNSNDIRMEENLLISSPTKKSKYSGQLHNEESQIDFSNLQIIDVCESETAFKIFSKKLLEQKTVAVSLACTSFANQRHSIGPTTVSVSKVTDKIKYVSKNLKLLGICFYWKNNIPKVYFLSLHEHSFEIEEKICFLLHIFFGTEERHAFIFDAKKQIKVLSNCCHIKFECCAYDPIIADWILEPENIDDNLQDMCLKYCSKMERLFKLVTSCNGKGSFGCNMYSTVDPRLRASVEVLATWHLMLVLNYTMKQRNEELLSHFRIEMDCIKLLAEMELVGIGINKDKLQSLTESLKRQLRDIEKFAFSLAGRRFNFNSSADVAKILGLCKNRSSSIKRISTNKQVLEHTDRPIAKFVLYWRKLNTTMTHLLQPLLRTIDGTHGRIHGTFVTRTATGRVSMHEPNIQNVPKEFQVEYLQDIQTINCREVFTCKEECILLSADYCHLELRLLAHISGDLVLCEIMRQSDQDVFKQIAAKWNNIQEKHVTDLLRQNAKNLCYGIIYGMGKKAIGEQLTITEEEVIILLESFHKKYFSIRDFISKTVKNCRQSGYIETLSGRRRFLPNINHHHAATKSQAERQAVNTTIQGSAADIVKKAMVIIDKMFSSTFKTSKYKPQLVLQIHDELLYEIPRIHVHLAANIIKTSMETSVELSVPFPVKLKTGKSWGEMTEYIA